MPSRSDNPQPKTLANGVVIPSSLQINEMTLAEWYRRAQWDEQFANLSKDQIRSLAQRMGFSPADIKKEIP